MRMVHCYIIGRSSFQIKDYQPCYDFVINLDYVGNEKSEFVFFEEIDFIKGDFLLARSEDDSVIDADSIKPVFLGVINDNDNLKISALMAFNVFDFNFAAFRINTSSWENTLLSIINSYFIGSSSDFLTSGISVSTGGTNTETSYIPSEPPTDTNFISFMLDGFKKTNVTIEVDSLELVNASNNSYKINFIIKQKTSQLQIKNNVYTFIDWDVYVNENSFNDFNKLLIIDKTSGTTTAPTILSTYYIQQDGTLVTSLNSNVFTPVKSKIFVYDQTEEEPPTYLSVAQSELSANTYSHEITFSFVENQYFLTVSMLEIGMISKIYYDDVLYESILTGISYLARDKLVSLTFGNIRSTLKSILKGV